jgi:septum site-determining protein MinC
MHDDNYVVFKGTNNGINVCLDEHASLDSIKEILRAKTLEARNFFEDAEISITFSGHPLTKQEEAELLDIIYQETDLSISYADSKKAERNTVPTEAILGLVPPSLQHSRNEQLTFFYEGALRNGQSIRYNGSVVLLGDANPGSEIIAKGNVIVMGALKGLVHAGCMGDETCYISALRMIPTQLRICDIITYIPEDKKSKNKNTPSYAYIQEGLIYIAPLLNS